MMELKLPQVTVGILSHNGLGYLPATLASVSSQNYPNLEIIVLDNGSTDGTSDILKQWPGITAVYESQNVGCGPARNRLVDLASGEYVLLLDDDVTLPDPQTILTFVEFSRSMHDRCLASLVLVEGNTALTTHYGLFFAPLKRAVRPDDLRTLRPFCVAAPVGGCTFVRRSVFEGLEGFDPIYPFNLGDYDLGARAYLRGIKAWILTSPQGVHQGGARRVDAQTWEWRQSYYLCGMVRILAKSCRLRNALIWIPGAAIWIAWRTVGQLRRRGLMPIARALLRSTARMVRDARSTLKERRRVQQCRVVNADGFLTMMPPGACQNLLAQAIARLAGPRIGSDRMEVSSAGSSPPSA
jgi:GT2 family glycosyltransferase